MTPETPQTESAATSRTVKRMLGLGLDSWNNLSVVFLAIGALAAVSIGVAQFAVIKLQKAEAIASKEAFEKYKVDAGLEVARLAERAAELAVEAAQLKTQMAWRTLTPETAETLQKRLSERPGSVEIQFIAGDSESQYFAIQLGNLFAKAKWQAAMTGLSMAGSVVWGILLPDQETPDGRTIKEAFESIGVKLSTESVPPPVFATGSGTPVSKGAPKLIVGSKKPPKTLTNNR